MSESILELPSPAKLNLFLHITGRRADGYHHLETLFQLLDGGDRLRFSLSDDSSIKFTCNREDLCGDDNLVVRAAKRLQEKNNFSIGATIHLEKHLAVGGGLGGGSSNAATTLLALNRLWKLNLSLKTLSELALELGADVPVFVEGRSAFARGIGEKLSPIQLDEKWFLVVTPQTSVATHEIFTHPELTRDSLPIKIPPRAVEGGRNDCQTVVECLYPEVAKTREWMERYAPAFLTGTGASLFSIFETEAQARVLAEKVPSHWHCFVTKGVNQSALHQQLETLE